MKKLVIGILLLTPLGILAKTVADTELSKGRQYIWVKFYSDELIECNARVENWKDGYTDMGRFVVHSKCKALPENIVKKMKDRDPSVWWKYEASMTVSEYK